MVRDIYSRGDEGIALGIRTVSELYADVLCLPVLSHLDQHSWQWWPVIV